MDDRPPPIDSSGASQPPLPPWRPPTPAPASRRTVPLRQMGTGEIIDAAIQLYRREWRSLIAIVALVLVPLTFVEGYLTRPFAAVGTGAVIAPGVASGVLISAVVVFIIDGLIVQPFLVAAVARAATNVYLGEPVRIGSTYRFALTRVLSILLISILTLLAIMVGLILLVIPAILVWVRLSFASTVLVVEGKRGTRAIGRSWSLAKGHFWRLFFTFIVGFVLTFVVALLLTIPTELIAASLGPNGWAVQALGGALANVLVTPFSTLIVVLLYFDLRIRKEGYDIEVMAQELAPEA